MPLCLHPSTVTHFLSVFCHLVVGVCHCVLSSISRTLPCVMLVLPADSKGWNILLRLRYGRMDSTDSFSFMVLRRLWVLKTIHRRNSRWSKVFLSKTTLEKPTPWHLCVWKSSIVYLPPPGFPHTQWTISTKAACTQPQQTPTNPNILKVGSSWYLAGDCL